MALTMTRTRTQTALNKLATLAAEIHGELAALESFCQERAACPPAAASRLKELRRHREAVYATLQQFDATLVPDTIGHSYDWLKVHGRGRRALQRYLAQYTAQD